MNEDFRKKDFIVERFSFVVMGDDKRFTRFYDYNTLNDIVSRYDIVFGKDLMKISEIPKEISQHIFESTLTGYQFDHMYLIWVRDGLEKQEYEITFIHEFLHAYEFMSGIIRSPRADDKAHKELEVEAQNIVKNHHDIVEYIQSFYDNPNR